MCTHLASIPTRKYKSDRKCIYEMKNFYHNFIIFITENCLSEDKMLKPMDHAWKQIHVNLDDCEGWHRNAKNYIRGALYGITINY